MSEAPATNRPEHVDHLDEAGELTPHPLVDVHDIARIARIPRALAAVGDLIDALRDSNIVMSSGVTIVAEPNTIAVTQPQSYIEQQKSLHDRQADYDRGRELWQAYLDNGTRPEHTFMWRYYLRREGITDDGAK